MSAGLELVLFRITVVVFAVTAAAGAAMFLDAIALVLLAVACAVLLVVMILVTGTVSRCASCPFSGTGAGAASCSRQVRGLTGCPGFTASAFLPLLPRAVRWRALVACRGWWRCRYAHSRC